MKTQIKIILVAIINLVFVFGIGIVTNFDNYWWVLFTAIYLSGTLVGTYFGAYVTELKMREVKE